MPSGDLPLFRAYPRLREGLPRWPLLEVPTPVEPLALDGIPPGRLFVKRDDRSAAAYGGNKPRKLEFLLAAAKARGSRRLITTGGLGTNHGLATAVHGAAAGFATTLVLVAQPVTEDVRRKLLLYGAWGADLRYGGSVVGAAVQGVTALSASLLRGERPTVVPTGGSGARGNLGFVSAAFELAEQIEAGILPEPAEIYVPVGSGGTQAGLVLGSRLAGLRSRIVGVLVTDIVPPSPRSMRRQALRTLRRLRAADPGIPSVSLEPADFPLLRDELGPGYGAPTESGRQAIAAAERAGLRLESTYTGKCLAAIRSRLAAAPEGGPVLFWNTYSSGDPEKGAPHPADPARLPRSFQRFLDDAPPR